MDVYRVAFHLQQGNTEPFADVNVMPTATMRIGAPPPTVDGVAEEAPSIEAVGNGTIDAINLTPADYINSPNLVEV